MTIKRACILGATGAAGQNIVESLTDHPWFKIDALAASSRSAGKRYGDAIKEAVFFEKTPGDKVRNMTVQNVDEIDPLNYDLAFTALPSGVAKGLEAKFAAHIPVFSTASAYRYEDDVPVLIPDVNPKHIALIDMQRRNRGWKGYIVPGPNCTTVGLVATLKPIMDAFGVKRVRMISMQSLSGAGEKGLRIDSPYRAKVEMNVYPYIEGEEEKVVRETNKILGSIVDGKIVNAGIDIHATCTRVYVDKVHTEVIDVETEKPATLDQIKAVLVMYESEPQRLGLPSTPERPILVFDEEDMPQPRLHREQGYMVTQVGRLQENPVLVNGFTYIVTSDNLEKGAGAGVVNAAEFLKVKGYL
ncbi:MAG: aspartate-semialdehyde dehydrogenase [Candidatus Bathyarchaeota archaeon]|jgi:aspartate-semialdehyde dehydrogenase|nr:aspartate-semialdehyde dehydrogenase [Candidatus Bathyarchaeota archaeon]